MKIKKIKFKDSIVVPDQMGRLRGRTNPEFNTETTDACHLIIVLAKKTVDIFHKKDLSLVCQVPLENIIYWVPAESIKYKGSVDSEDKPETKGKKNKLQKICSLSEGNPTKI